MVEFSGTQNFLVDCDCSQVGQNSGGPAGVIGVLVNSQGGEYYITNTHLSDFTQAIVVYDGPNLTRLFCSNVTCESYSNALVLQPPGAKAISQVYCSDCLFSGSKHSQDPLSTGVIIGNTGGTPDKVAEIFLNNCMVINWSLAGVLINQASQVVITGGRYGSNASGTGSTYGGITISQPAADVTISGADLTPQALGDSFPTQLHAIAITAAPNRLYVRGCNMTGYSGSPLSLTSPSPVTAVEITDCAGYNDQGTIVSTTAPSPSGTQFNGTFSGFTTPYFGPVTFYVRSGTGTITHIKLNGIDTMLTSGAFSVGPGAWKAEIDYTGTGLNFLMIGY